MTKRTSKRQQVEMNLGKATTLHVFCTFFQPSLHDQDRKMPNFTFYGGRKQAMAKFSFSSSGVQLGGGSGVLCWVLNSHKCISLIYVRQFSLGKLPFLISVLLKISALFSSAEVSPVIMEVKINPGLRTQKKCPFPPNRGHSSL